jgi:arsenate reductase
MAEGILRRAAGDVVEVQSAGSHPADRVHPKAIQVMNEVGIDISQNRSKHLNEDPAKVQGTEGEVLDVFRKVRNEITRVFEAYGAGIRLAAKR